jgi:hypothetical protein
LGNERQLRLSINLIAFLRDPITTTISATTTIDHRPLPQFSVGAARRARLFFTCASHLSLLPFFLFDALTGQCCKYVHNALKPLHDSAGEGRTLYFVRELKINIRTCSSHTHVRFRGALGARRAHFIKNAPRCAHRVQVLN